MNVLLIHVPWNSSDWIILDQGVLQLDQALLVFFTPIGIGTNGLVNNLRNSLLHSNVGKTALFSDPSKTSDFIPLHLLHRGAMDGWRGFSSSCCCSILLITIAYHCLILCYEWMFDMKTWYNRWSEWAGSLSRPSAAEVPRKWIQNHSRSIKRTNYHNCSLWGSAHQTDSWNHL